MAKEILKIRIDNGLGNSNPTFKDIELDDYSGKFPRMGFPDLTATLMWPTPLDDEWTHREYVVLRGENFYVTDTPDAEKTNNSVPYKHSLGFTSEFARILGNTYFEDYVPDHSATYNKPCSNSSKFTFYGTIGELCDRLNCSFIKAGIADSILKTKTSLTTFDTPVGDGYCVMLDPYGADNVYDPDKTYSFEWEKKTHWEAITEGFNITEIPFERHGKCVVFGAVPKVLNHKFEYGHDNELLSIKHKNAKAKVINRITMQGSSENIPHYYPNDTEYGHIELNADPNNSTLQSSMLSIVNYTPLLALVREGEFIRYKEKIQTAVSADVNNEEFKTGFFHVEDLETVKRKQVVTLKYPSEHIENWWYVSVSFEVPQFASYTVNSFYGCIWSKNTGSASISNLIGSSVSIYQLHRVDGFYESDITGNVSSDGNGKWVMNNLLAGKYKVIFRIPIRMTAHEDMFFLIDHIDIAAKANAKYSWYVGDKEYSKLGKLGIKLNGTASDGDGFKWTASERVPFQTNLIPPKYRNTLGAERYYDAISYNLISNSEDVYVEGTNNYAHVGLFFEKSPVLDIGDRFAISVDSLTCISGNADEFSVAIYNFTEKKMVTNLGTLTLEKKSAILTVENVPSVNNAIVYVVLYAGKYGHTQGNFVRYEKIMVVRGVKAMEWRENAVESSMLEYIDPDTHEAYLFPNPYTEKYPSEYIHKNEDIKPTIEGVKNANGELFGVIADIAYDTDDNDSLKAESSDEKDKNDSLKYEHSFFYIKLNIFDGSFGFDLFAHASQTDAMTIQMRDGSCNGCKFKIQSVKFTDESGLETYKNPIIVQGGKAVGVISESNIAESYLDPAQQNTETNSIWICVQKDAETFGVIMPNQTNNFKPKIGDTFNIINIDLPKSYILAAEKRLEEDGMRFMADNNEEKFSFDISASRIFFAEHPEVLSELDEYSKIKVQYNGYEYEQYVNQLSIECKSNEPLPNIGIDLTDTLATSQSFVEQVAERASSLIANPYTMSGGLSASGGGISTQLTDKRYLNKTISDRSAGKISSDIGFEVGEFVSGSSGGIFYQDPETGRTFLEVDMLKARMKAIFEELEIAKVSTIGGKFIITPGGGLTISFVEELKDSYRCYFKAKDEDRGAKCRLVVGDQVQCREFNIQDGLSEASSNRYYWRLVTAVNNDESYIELSKTDFHNAYEMPKDIPAIGDTIVQLGNRNDPERQSAIILSTEDTFAPCVTLYNGINRYTLATKAVVEYGVDKTQDPPEPFFNCYGRFFFGPRNKKSYLAFHPSDELLEFKGKISVLSTVGDDTLEDYVDNVAQSVSDATKSELQGKIDALQNQVDGVVEAWSYPYTPTTANYPANQWTTDGEKNAHVGDVFYNIQPAYNEDGTPNPDAGKAWRWSQNDSEHSGYHWHPIADSDAVRALQLAQMSVLDTDVLYKQIESQTDAPALPLVNTSGVIVDLKGWSTNAPDWKADKYIWQTTYVKKGDGSATFSKPTCISGRNGVDGSQGPQGVPGPQGPGGQTYYTWIRYADDAQGNGISNNPSGKEYIGFAYNKTTAIESNNKSDYTWSEIKGEQGVPGAQGADGKTYYTWIQYSDNANGNPMYQQPNANTKYIGIAVNKESATEGNNPADYTWSLFKGADGINITILSQSVKYSTNHGETQPADTTFTLTDVPTLSAGQYLWSMTTVTYSNGQSTKSYAVSRIGVDGTQGGSYTPNLLVGTEAGKLIPPTGTAVNGYAYGYYDLDDLVDFNIGSKYSLSVEKIENIHGNPTQYSARLYDIVAKEDISSIATLTQDNPSCVLEIIKSSQSPSIKLILYAGVWGNTTGNQVRFTKPMLVKGDTSIGWSPASSEMIAPVIISSSVTYAKSTSSVQPADSQFTHTTIGAVGLGAGDYLWTKTEVNYSDGNSTKSYSVSRIGSDGDDGLPGLPGADGKTPYVHYAYSNSANGQTGFSTTYFKDALYVGVCSDYNQADPTTYSSYEWSRLRGEDGTPAKIVVVNADATAFVYKDNFATLVTPATINLSAMLQGTTGYQWSYKKEGATAFTNVSGGTNATLSVLPTNTTFFPSGARACVFRCTSGDVYDEVTIVKVSSGINGTDGANYSPNLLKNTESLTIPASTTNAYNFRTYHFDTPLEVKVGDKFTFSVEDIEALEGSPDAFSVYLYNSDSPAEAYGSILTITKAKAYATLNVTKATTAKSIIVYAGKSSATEGNSVKYTKAMLVKGETPMPWSPAASEMVGEDAYTILLSNESHIFEGDTEKAVAANTTSQVIAYKGATQIAANIGTITGMPAGMTVTISNNGTTSAKFTINVTTALTTKQGTLNIPVMVDGKTFTQVFSWSLSLKGKDGRGISSVVEQYAIHSSGTVAPEDSEFSDGVKTMTDAKPYLWNREITTYTDNTSKTTLAVCIGVKGQNGADGATVVSVTNYYLASSKASGVNTSDTGWVTNASHANATTDATKPYLWNYEVTKWSKGADTSTAPHVVGKFGKDGNGILRIEEEYCLSDSSSTPTPNVWYDEAHKPTWVAGKYMWTRTHVYYTDGTDEIFGEVCVTGATGTSVLAQYSADAIDWHPSFVSGDVWMQTSSDGGNNWTSAIKIIGTDGDDGQYRKFQWAKNTSTTTAPTSGWDDAPMTASAGEYVWMRSGIVVPPATEPAAGYDTATRVTGDKGADGQSVYMLDLSNEVMGILCNSSGTVTEQYPTSQASVWMGSTKLESGITYSIAQTDGVSATITTAGVVTPSALIKNNAIIVVQAEVDGITLQSTISLYKVRAGVDSMMYYIETSVDNITRGFTGELSADTITAIKKVQNGDNAPATTPMNNLYYQRIGEDAEEVLGSKYGSQKSIVIEITDKTESVILTLRDPNTNVVYDRERIPILTDASDIEVGTRNIVESSKTLTIYNPQSLYSNNRLKLLKPLKQGEVYALSIQGIIIDGLRNVSGRFMAKIISNDTTKEIASVKNISPDSPFGLFRIQEDSGADPWLYLYAGDEASNRRLVGNTGLTISRIDFERISVVKGNVPLQDWTESPEDTQKRIGKFDYLSKAMKEDSSINGGLFLASTVSLGKNNTDYTSQITWSGLNGIYNEDAIGGGIALWVGGDMYDLAEYYDWDNAKGEWTKKDGVTTPLRIANGVDRMDGSGYRAGGHLWWDGTGNTTFVGDIVARGTFRGLRRRAHTVITSQNINDYMRIDDAGQHHVDMDATGALVDFRVTPENTIYIPSSDMSYLGETIIIINGTGGRINLGGRFIEEGSSVIHGSLTIEPYFIFQATFKIRGIERGLDGVVAMNVWEYSLIKMGQNNIPNTPIEDGGPLAPIL